MSLLKEFILENWTLKLMSVLLAWILWLFVRGEPGTERVITVPFEVRISRDMEITNERPNSVDVTVRGIIPNTWFGQTIPTCSIDLQGYSEGEHNIPLSPANVHLPRASGLEVLKITPARVTLVLEKTISKEVPIVVTTRGEPPSGFDVYDKTASPSVVLLTGPRSHVERLQHIATEPVPLTGEEQSIRMLSNLNIRDNMVRSMPVGPVEVKITIGVHRKLTTVPNVPVQVDDGNYTTSPQKVSIHVLVPIDFKGSLAASDFSVTVSTKNLSEPESTLPERVKPEARLITKLDPAIVIKEVQPAEVTVRRK